MDKKEEEQEVETISLKSNQSINESNLMVIPFISMKKTKVKVLERYWISNGVRRGIKVVGSGEHGCPTIAELDVLLALFRILIKNVGFKYEYNRTTGKVSLPKTIHFTYQELSKELGYKTYGGALKKKLENSVKCLNEATIYSDLGLRDVEAGDYIYDFEGEDSFRILEDYKSFSYTKRKKKGEKIGDAKQVKSMQSVTISDFFFKNICNNYFKIYNYNQYLMLTKGVAKKLYLLLNQWSRGYEKYLTYIKLYDMLSLDVAKNENNEEIDKKKAYYYNRIIKDALDELTTVKFIQDYDIRTNDGINLIFNINKRNKNRFLDKYNDEKEIINRLQEIGLTLKEWTKYYRLDNQEYVKALLRYVDYKIENKNDIRDVLKFTIDGLKSENYDVKEFIG
ncbi:TPA: replication initiator protein A [Clostridium botulinum]|uniref:replication initiator protein A n=1 Tax=Clostridium botulinum TaxID=1491 RepID=UPI00077348EF|nr:replication initiator protein A [Clostridium botulinum]APH21003.1 replication initiator A family protein [Clostridium botulinum]APQ71289.1 replication initiator A family protein [Clostridium botulinum]APR02401.1 replication initiator A family protein [Clostridium botulinum]AUN01453.1 hypothetical protein RSJ19_00280 [Clostridium botulinum]